MLRNVHEIKIQKRRLCFWKSFVYFVLQRTNFIFPETEFNELEPCCWITYCRFKFEVKEEFESVIQIRTGDRQLKFTKFGPGLSESVRQLTYKCIFFQNYLNFVFTKLVIKIKYKLGVGDPGTWSLISSIKLFISAEN